jgi:TonB family protein
MRLTSLLVFLSLSVMICSAQTITPVQSAVAPHYPPIAVAARVEGTVSVRVRIDSQGDVVHAEVIDGPRLLKLGAEDTAKLWKFEPATENDRTATLKFVYVLLLETADAEYDVKFKPPYEVVIEKHPAKQ